MLQFAGRQIFVLQVFLYAAAAAGRHSQFAPQQSQVQQKRGSNLRDGKSGPLWGLPPSISGWKRRAEDSQEVGPAWSCCIILLILGWIACWLCCSWLCHVIVAGVAHVCFISGA